MNILTATCLVIVGVSAGGLSFGAMTSQEREEVITEAQAAFEAGDYPSALALVLPLAQQGDPDAEFTVGILALHGIGFDNENPTQEEREVKAWEWIKKAAVHGNEEAIMHVSDVYKNGWYGLPKSEGLSTCWREALKNKSKVSECLELEKKLFPDRSDPTAR